MTGLLTGTHTFIGLKNFITLFTKDILFFKVMKNTFVYVIAYVGLNVIIALGMAVWITSLKKANQFFRSVFFSSNDGRYRIFNHDFQMDSE